MKIQTLFLSSCAALSLGMPMTASAQSAPSDARPSLFEDDQIIVTARRREERLQDVPVSVGAVTPTMLTENNITSVVQLSRVAPSLVITPGLSAGRSVPHVAIRGLSQQEGTMLGDPSVPFYIGDIVAARAQGINGALFDIASVEVLRGPQGTLFGRNSTGGAVVIRPQRPKDEFGGRLSITYGRFDNIQTEAVLNVPLSETISLRLAGATNKDDGFFYDEALGRNVDYTDNKAARVSLLFKSPSDVESLTVYNFFKDDSGGTPTFLKLGVTTAAVQQPAQRELRNYRPIDVLQAEQEARGIYRGKIGVPQFSQVETHDVANTTTIPITPEISIKNIIGYRHIKDRLFNDSDGIEHPILHILRLDHTSQFTEEFQVIGDMGRFNWISGLYYFWERGRNQGISIGNPIDPGLIEPNFRTFEEAAANFVTIPAGSASNTDVAARNISYAAFVQGDFEVVSGLTATAGIRFNTDKRRAIIRNRTASACRFTLDTDNDPSTPEVRPPLGNCLFTADAKFSKPTYNVGLRYEIDNDRMVYVAHRHGYRTGGFGARAATQQGLSKTFRPEVVDDVELGLKADWHPGGDMLLRTNIAAYYANYKDLQRLITDPTTLPLTTTAQNAGKARIKGLELDILFRPIPQIELTANYAYTDAKYKSFFLPNPANPSVLDDHSKDPFGRAPKNVYTLGARFTQPLNDGGTISIGGNYFHSDRYAGNESYDPYVYVNGYNLVNVDARWDSVMGSPIDISAFINNLTKERYSYLYSSNPASGVVVHSPGAPRTWGVRMTVHFGASGD